VIKIIKTLLKKFILESDFKQCEISKKTGIHESRLSQLANDYKQPSDGELELISNVLGVPVEKLKGGADEQKD
jgi:transcriptional regulator with XRE-family HTH domain